MRKLRKYDNFLLESKLSKLIKKLDIDGFEVLLGRNSDGNDFLTTMISNENDWWFHAKGIPGSHVVIKVKDNEPSLETIKKVANIAAVNSKCDTEYCEVLYCKNKFVSKNKEHKSGQVSVDYKNSHIVKVKVEK